MGLLDALADFIVRLVKGREAADERKSDRLALAARARVAAEELDRAKHQARIDRGEF